MTAESEDPDLEGWRERLEPSCPAGDRRPRDRLGRLEPRLVCADPVATFRAVLALAGLWEKVVPDEHVLHVEDREEGVWSVVLCPCGQQTVLGEPAWRYAAGEARSHRVTGAFSLPHRGVTECAGGCSRFFLPWFTGEVRVHRFELEAAA